MSNNLKKLRKMRDLRGKQLKRFNMNNTNIYSLIEIGKLLTYKESIKMMTEKYSYIQIVYM